MTYTILGRQHGTKRIGVAIATHSIAAGGYCQRVISDLGVVVSQAFADPRLLGMGVDLLRGGASAAQAVDRLGDADEYYEYRQVAIVTPSGDIAVHTGSATASWAGHLIGDDFIATGNALVGNQVLTAMAEGFTAADDVPLEERLVRALETGRDAGGQRDSFYERSATLVVHEHETFPDIDLRVDLHETDAVDELGRMLHRYRPYLHIYNHLRTKEPDRAALLTNEDWDPHPPSM